MRAPLGAQLEGEIFGRDIRISPGQHGPVVTDQRPTLRVRPALLSHALGIPVLSLGISGGRDHAEGDVDVVLHGPGHHLVQILQFRHIDLTAVLRIVRVAQRGEA